MKKLFVLFPLVLMLAACGEESDMKKVVRATLIDPDSAKFGEFTKVGENGACVAVNAKNRFGGFTGDKEILLKKINGVWVAISDQTLNHSNCLMVLEKFLSEEKGSKG